MKRFILLTILSSLICAVTSTAQVSGDLYRNTPVGGVLSSGTLPDLVAYNQQGEKLNLKELCKDKYTLLIMGCITCPLFRDSQPGIEAINADYSSRGVQFLYVYKKLRHPELGGYVEAQKISERLLMVEHIKELLGGEIEWIVDDIDDNISSFLRAGSRSVYLISPKGDIAQAWSQPQEQDIRQALTKAVGAPKRVTSATELNLPTPSRVARGINVEGDNTIQRSDGLVILKTTPLNPDDTYYVKMRAEADAALLESGTGRMALGFFPDPLYEAHWNNLAEPMKFTLTLPDGATASPQEASAKRGKGDSDSEPRQFWVDIKGASPSDVIEITFHYYGCSPDMCEAFTHSYTIELTPEANGASTFGFNRGQRGNHSSERGSHSERGTQGRSSNRNSSNSYNNSTYQNSYNNRSNTTQSGRSYMRSSNY